MSTYITVYVIAAILLLLLINFGLINRKKSSNAPEKKSSETVSKDMAHTEIKKAEPKENIAAAHKTEPGTDIAAVQKAESETDIAAAQKAESETDIAAAQKTEPEADISSTQKPDPKAQEIAPPELSMEEMPEDSAVSEPPAKEQAESEIQQKESISKKKKSPSKDSEDASGTGKILVAIMLGAFVAILNQTLLNVAIPHIMNDLGVTANTVQWLSTGYMLVNGIAIPITAYLTEKFGTRKLFISAIFLFTLGSLVCSLSPNFSMLMAGRIIQACGAGIIMPLLMTVFFTLFPPEKRGKAMGIMGTVIIFAPAIGPTLSGWLIGHYSWRFLFDIVIPFGILDLVLCFLWLKDVTKVTKPKFDFPGFVLSTIGFGFLLYGFSEAGNDGWTSTTVILSFVIGIISLAAFVWRELTVEKPMLDLRVFKYDIFSLTTIVSMLVNMAMYGAMILLPIYLQNIRGYTALQSGLMMLPGAIVMGIMSPISGALYDKFGVRWLAVIGLSITAFSTWQFTTLSMTTSFSKILLLYLLRSFGISFIMMTIMTEGLNQLPRRLGSHGTAASNTAKQVAGSIGTALLVTIMSTRQGVHYGEYTNTVASSNPIISGGFSQLTQLVSGYTHLPAAAGNELTTYLIYGQAMQQSTIDGINDAFIFATGIAIVGLVLSFFIKRARFKE